MEAETKFTMQFMAIGPFPNVVLVAAETLMVPFCTMPLVKVATGPVVVSVNPPRSNVPLVTMRLLMLLFAFKRQTLLPVTTVTLSVLDGVPLGDQFAGVFQAVDTEPFQV